jgi:hypothetical protein
MPTPLQVNKAVVSLTRTTPQQLFAPFSGAYLTVLFSVLVVKVYIFRRLFAAMIAKELCDEISIFSVKSASVKEYKDYIDDEVIN